MKILKGHYVPKELITSEAVHEAVVKVFVAAGFEDERPDFGDYESASGAGLCIADSHRIIWGGTASCLSPLTLQQLFTAENGLQWPTRAYRVAASATCVWFDLSQLPPVVISGTYSGGNDARILVTRQPGEKEVKNTELDRFIISENGVWPYVATAEFMSAGTVSKDEFERRAKELGFIGKYRWGVEYPTNGKRPDLADDVSIELRCGTIYGKGKVRNYADWSSASSFKITDPRYKPADTSYLNTPTQAQSLTHSEEGLTHSEWWDYEKCEPIGCRLPSIGDHVLLYEYECVVLAKDGNAVWVKNVTTNKKHSVERNNVLKPLDHATRKADLERKALIQQGYEIVGLDTTFNVLEKLIDAGWRPTK